MNIKNKLFVDENEIRDLCLSLKDKKTVLCHGHFNVIHPGHLRFLHHAKEQGAYLIVAVESDADLQPMQKEKFFSQDERAGNVTSLHIVDKVVLLGKVKLIQLITLLEPNYWVMGREHESNILNMTGQYADIAKEYKGNLIFHSGSVNYASSNLLDYSSEFLETNNFNNVCQRNNIDIDALKEKLNSFSRVKMLVIGDTIVDQFVACDPVGMSAESPVLVIKEIESKEFIGGAAVVARHVKSLGAECHFISVIGDDLPGKTVADCLKKESVNAHLSIDNDRPTTYKIRYMVENQKMLRVSRLEDFSVRTEIEDCIINKLNEIIPQVDGIIISDFVYGLITPNILEHIILLAKQNGVKLFGDLQCSSQIGSILKFRDFTLLTPTEKEARVALNDNDSGIEKIARTIIEKANCENLILKLGSEGFVAYCNSDIGIEKKGWQHFSALATNPVDVAGAGDIVLSLMSLCLCAGFTLLESAALGTCAAAIAVNRIGNIPITLYELRQYLCKIRSNKR